MGSMELFDPQLMDDRFFISNWRTWIMADYQLQMEIDWCLARLEEKLAAMDPYSRPAQEAAKVHRILKSSKAPVIKKRQAMRNMFGDYRAKMKKEEKKSLTAMKKSKLVAAAECPSQSKFLRRGTGSQTPFQGSADRAVSEATASLTQLSVDPPAPASDCPKASTSQASPAAAAAAGVQCSSDVFPSSQTQEFKFNFDSSEQGPSSTTGGISSGDDSGGSGGDALHQNYFVIKPSNQEFMFNFPLDDNQQQ